MIYDRLATDSKILKVRQFVTDQENTESQAISD